MTAERQPGTALTRTAAILRDVLPALGRLDRRLERASAAADAAFGSAGDPYRGLYVAPDDVKRLLARAPGAPVLAAEGSDPTPARAEDSRLGWLERTFDLSPFDMDVVLIALAPEVDLRYERLYGYLHDDVSKKRPSVDLALNLLCGSAEAKLERRRHFSSEAPLVRHRILHLLPDPAHVQPPLLAHYLKLDDQIVRALLGQDGLDPRLTPFSRLVEPALDDLGRTDGAKALRAIAPLVAEARALGQPLTLYLHGPREAGKREAAHAVAAGAGARLLTFDVGRALAADPDFSRTAHLLFRETALLDAVLYLEPLDALRGEDRATAYQALLDGIAESRVVAILAGVLPWVPSGSGPTGTLVLSVGIPDVAERRAIWRSVLASREVVVGDDDLNALADRFRMSPHQIEDAVDTARVQARCHAVEAAEKPGDRPAAMRLFAAARAQSGHELSALARRIEPIHSWADIVLPVDVEAQLREICQQVVHRDRVLGQWGFGRKLSYGKGVTALFAGPSGTGKTMAAEVLASTLELDLYAIDLAQVVDKYIGETEKRLDRIFAAAENADGILFFDEADALFGKRSEVRDSHDRYANIEIAYLLQKMEQYDGIAILATNFRQNMDEAFARRLGFVVEFPFPDETYRYRIWQSLFPADTPREDGIDYGLLSRLRLAGGNIKNIVLGAAYLAAADGGRVGMAHLVHATRRECQKIGRVLPEAELGAYSPALAGAGARGDP